MGVISLHTFTLFHCEGQLGRVTALSVSASSRRKGIGKLLLQAADEFFLSRGCARSEVTSGDHRTQAHEFYRSHGYCLDERRFVKSYKSQGSAK